MTMTVDMLKKYPKKLKSDGTPDMRCKDNFLLPLWRFCKEPKYREKNRLKGKYLKIAKKAILEKQNGKCMCCRKSITVRNPLDHIIPFCASHSNYYKNLQMICYDCHAKKTDMEIFEGVYKIA